jgi:iron complex transport system ATP-binding protein
MSTLDSQAISVKDLSFSYGKRQVIKNTTVGIDSETLTAIVGPNGCGKSTFLKLVSGYLKAPTGSVKVRGEDISTVPSSRRSTLLAYTGDEPDPVFGYSVEETVMMGRIARQNSLGSDKDCLEALEALGLLDLKNRSIDSLSSGERQRTYIARAIYQDPMVFLLDEPTAHFDLRYELLIMELAQHLVERLKKTVVMVVHDLDLAIRYASRILMMKEGRIVLDIEPQTLTQEMIERVYGVETSLVYVPQIGSKMVLPIRPS